MEFLFEKPKYTDDEKRLIQHWHEFTTQTNYTLDHIQFKEGSFFASIKRDEAEPFNFGQKLRYDLTMHQLEAQIMVDKFRYYLRVRLAKKTDT
jgi:hypothetical protein